MTRPKAHRHSFTVTITTDEEAKARDVAQWLRSLVDEKVTSKWPVVKRVTVSQVGEQ